MVFHNHAFGAGIGHQLVADHLRVHQAELQLVGLKPHGGVAAEPGLQQLHLPRVHVAHAEMAHFAGFVQGGERFNDFLGLHQRVRPVQQREVHIVGAERFQLLVQPRDEMLRGEVITGCVHVVRIAEIDVDAELRLQEDVLSLKACVLPCAAKHLRAGMVAIDVESVDVRSVEEVDAVVGGRTHDFCRRVRFQRVHAHYAERHLRCGYRGFADFDFFHDRSIFLRDFPVRQTVDIRITRIPFETIRTRLASRKCTAKNKHAKHADRPVRFGRMPLVWRVG